MKRIFFISSLIALISLSLGSHIALANGDEYGDGAYEYNGAGGVKKSPVVEARPKAKLTDLNERLFSGAVLPYLSGIDVMNLGLVDVNWKNYVQQSFRIQDVFLAQHRRTVIGRQSNWRMEHWASALRKLHYFMAGLRQIETRNADIDRIRSKAASYERQASLYIARKEGGSDCLPNEMEEIARLHKSCPRQAQFAQMLALAVYQTNERQDAHVNLLELGLIDGFSEEFYRLLIRLKFLAYRAEIEKDIVKAFTILSKRASAQGSDKDPLELGIFCLLANFKPPHQQTLLTTLSDKLRVGAEIFLAQRLIDSLGIEAELRAGLSVTQIRALAWRLFLACRILPDATLTLQRLETYAQGEEHQRIFAAAVAALEALYHPETTGLRRFDFDSGVSPLGAFAASDSQASQETAALGLHFLFELAGAVRQREILTLLLEFFEEPEDDSEEEATNCTRYSSIARRCFDLMVYGAPRSTLDIDQQRLRLRIFLDETRNIAATDTELASLKYRVVGVAEYDESLVSHLLGLLRNSGTYRPLAAAQALASIYDEDHSEGEEKRRYILLSLLALMDDNDQNFELAVPALERIQSRFKLSIFSLGTFSRLWWAIGLVKTETLANVYWRLNKHETIGKRLMHIIGVLESHDPKVRHLAAQAIIEFLRTNPSAFPGLAHKEEIIASLQALGQEFLHTEDGLAFSRLLEILSKDLANERRKTEEESRERQERKLKELERERAHHEDMQRRAATAHALALQAQKIAEARRPAVSVRAARFDNADDQPVVARTVSAVSNQWSLMRKAATVVFVSSCYLFYTWMKSNP